MRAAWGLPILLCAAACGGGGAGPPDAAAPDACAEPCVPDVDAAPTPDAPPGVDAEPGRSCASAIPLVPGAPAVMATTVGGSYATRASCAGDSMAWPDRYFQVEAGAAPVDLTVDVAVDEAAMTPFDAVVSARGVCAEAQSEILCVNSGWSDRLELLGVSGRVYLVVDGTTEFGGVSQGAFDIAVTARAIAAAGAACDPAGAASRCGADLVCQAGTCAATSAALACAAAVDLTADLADGSAEASGTVHAFDPDYYRSPCAWSAAAGAPERIYRIDLAAPATLTATTDDAAGTTYDTVLYLRKDACDGLEVACNDEADGATHRSTLAGVGPLAAGTYYLFVDQSSSFVDGSPFTTARQYHLTVTRAP